VETTATAESSTVARLGRSVEAAAAQRSPLEGAVARFAKYYTPVVLAAALLIAFVPWATNSSNSHKVILDPADLPCTEPSYKPIQTVLLWHAHG
jgi:cation transport ATPase